MRAYRCGGCNTRYAVEVAYSPDSHARSRWCPVCGSREVSINQPDDDFVHLTPQELKRPPKRPRQPCPKCDGLFTANGFRRHVAACSGVSLDLSPS
jgi:DNA-directed RNA polymerase subunit RPC12/RpoP